MELYFVIKLVGLINNAKGFKACLLSMFRFGDIYQLFLVRVGRTAHGSDLCRANHERRSQRKYLVLLVSKDIF